MKYLILLLVIVFPLSASAVPAGVDDALSDLGQDALTVGATVLVILVGVQAMRLMRIAARSDGGPRFKHNSPEHLRHVRRRIEERHLW